MVVKTNKNITFVRILLIYVNIALLFVSCLTDDELSARGNELSIGQTLPRFTADVILLDTADWRYCNAPSVTYDSKSANGRLTVIAFFNTTCPDCQRELPVLQQFYDEVKADSTLTLLCIAREEPKDEVMQYWEQHNLKLPVSPQPDRMIYEMFATSGIPRIYFADRQGKITQIFDDKDKPSLDDLKAATSRAREINN